MTGGALKIRIWVGLLMAGLLVCAGCGASTKDDYARRLSPGEAEKLLARQAGKMDSKKEPEQNDPVQLEAQGDALAVGSDPAAALFPYNRALGLVEDKDRPRLRNKMGRVYLLVGQFPQAQYIFRALIDKGERRGLVYEGLGLALMGQDKLAEAEDALLRAVEVDNRLWKSLNSLGIIYNRTKRPVRAKSAFLQAIRIKPDEAALYNNLGMACLMGEDLSGAEWSFRRALELKADYPRAANNLGLVMARQRNYDQALQAFERGVGEARAHNNLGCFLAWEGQYDRAAEQFTMAMHNNPTYYPLASQHLGAVRRTMESRTNPPAGAGDAAGPAGRSADGFLGGSTPPPSLAAGLRALSPPAAAAPQPAPAAVRGDSVTASPAADTAQPAKPMPPDLAFPRLEDINSTVMQERYGMRREDASFQTMRSWLGGTDLDE